MAKKATSTNLSSSEFNDETSSEDQLRKSTKRRSKKGSIKSYVSDVLTKHDSDEGRATDLAQTRIKIDTSSNNFRNYENASAFRQYGSNAEGTSRTNAHRQGQSSSSDDELKQDTSTAHSGGDGDDSIAELNLDPNPIFEERESAEQVYKQKVYLRQLQPPTPQPLEIQVQEVLIKPQIQKLPIHVHVGHQEPRTPSPIVIKSAPPPAPPEDSGQPIIYNKYLPPPKQPPQQIIIHRHADLPPKPRPIVVEQWLPYKPAPKRIIKHSLPRELLQTPPPPHNIIVAYSKPRALIEVELVRLPVVRIDPQTYQQISAGGEEQILQHPSFQHERNYLSGNNSSNRTNNDSNRINWRI
ncbi:unnamed protein product [Adineta steineri]|uniref:Uncharacterized protein n=1 Tax=Adineta steineri TaxID=433720 RepID=A0A814QL27_9BILA|nr:unnamed protein product [Adineta steineri]CAF1457464.1 unnamed protein product [Adineta steineri]CAF1459215.1 unnamed protein product [Adineta steineri]